jgi:predicted phosphoribosyltransferase
VSTTFADRREAGLVLSERLAEYRGLSDVVVMALPRGGVPVGYEIARALEAPFDVFLVRKLGLPGREELAMGAIAAGDVLVVNDDVVSAFHVGRPTIDRVAEREGRELQRRALAYRDGRPGVDVTAKVVILVDDGLATGSSMLAAVKALRALAPARIVVAVPAAPASTCRDLEAEADAVVCATTPDPFYAVGQAYADFTQTTDTQVRGLLALAAEGRAATKRS